MRCAFWLAIGPLPISALMNTIDESNAANTINNVASSDSNIAYTADISVRHILHFSDVHLNLSKSLNTSESAKIPIAYGSDAPNRLLVSALKYAKELLHSPDVFLCTGDHVVHGELSKEYLAAAVEENVETIAKYFSPTDNETALMITEVIGNSDTSPDYTMNVTDPKAEENPTIASISKAWQNTLSIFNFDWFNRRGYLAHSLYDNLTVITLNTLPYSISPFCFSNSVMKAYMFDVSKPNHLPDTSDTADPFKQFEWLNISLFELRKAKKMAYIVGHILPTIDSYAGAPMWTETYIKTYKQIVNQYADIIKAQIFGHVHSIEFRLPLSSSVRPQFQQFDKPVVEASADSSELVPLFIAAAISPLFSNNPAFLVWDFDATNYDILDFTVYGGNISNATEDVDWKALFRATTEYGISSLNASEITSFVKLAAADAQLLEQYYFNSKAQSHHQSSCLDATCQAKWLCSLYWWATIADFSTCVASTKESVTWVKPATESINTSSTELMLLASMAIVFGG